MIASDRYSFCGLHTVQHFRCWFLRTSLSDGVDLELSKHGFGGMWILVSHFSIFANSNKSFCCLVGNSRGTGLLVGEY